MSTGVSCGPAWTEYEVCYAGNPLLQWEYGGSTGAGPAWVVRVVEVPCAGMASEYLENLKARRRGGNDKLEENLCEKIQSTSSLYQGFSSSLSSPPSPLDSATQCNQS